MSSRRIGQRHIYETIGSSNVELANICIKWNLLLLCLRQPYIDKPYHPGTFEFMEPLGAAAWSSAELSAVLQVHLAG